MKPARRPWRRQLPLEDGGRIGLLMGMSAEPEITETPVGWMVVVPFSVRGVGHICGQCRPVQPAGMVPVYRAQLAATEPCRMCRRRLEEVSV